jgi:hypothetical protein
MTYKKYLKKMKEFVYWTQMPPLQFKANRGIEQKKW